MAPWWRGPLLLLRRGAVAAALVAAAAVAALPAAAAAPFLSSSRDAILHHQIAAACPWSVGITATGALGTAVDPGADGLPEAIAPASASDLARELARDTRQAVAAAGSVTSFGAVETTLLAVVTGPDRYPIWLVSRQDAGDHIQMVDGVRGPGIVMTDQYAAFVHRSVGDRLTLAGPAGSVTAPITGLYRSLRLLPDQPWWCDLRAVYRAPGGNAPPPEVILVDQRTLLDLAARLRLSATYEIGLALRDPHLNSDQARQAVAGIAQLRRTLIAPTGNLIVGPGPSDRPYAWGPAAINAGRFVSRLSHFTDRADLGRRAMLAAVVPIAAAGVLVGLLVVATAATFWVRRRRGELTMLATRGVGAAGLAVKAIAESLPALLAGVAVGWSGAWALVRVAGPDPVLSGEAGPGALLGAVGTLLATIAAIGAVAGIACRGLVDRLPARRRRLLRWAPYELVVLAAALVVWGWLGDQRQTGDPANGLGTAVHVPARLLIVPIMVVFGLTLLAARLAVLCLRRGAARRAPRAPAAFLGWRRIGRQAAMTAVLAGATSVPIALAVYGATVTGSVRSTIADEARLHVGSDVVLTLNRRAPIPASLAGHATEVLRLDGAMIGGVQTDLLAVDPDTFARAAYWDERLDHASLPTLMDPIRGESGGDSSGGRLRVVASARTPSGSQEASWIGDEVLGGHIEVVSTAVLPAQRTGYPVALVPQGALGDDTQYAAIQLWVRGDPARITAAVEAARLPVKQVVLATDLYANSLWEPLTYTFDYLTALSLLTGVVTVVGLLLYLESQLPTYRRAFVLMRRMGLSARSHRAALLGELAVPLVGGLLGGVAVAAGLTTALGGDFEMNPTVPPATVIAVPYVPLSLIAVAVVLVALAAAHYAQSRIGRAKPSEVLRDAN